MTVKYLTSREISIINAFQIENYSPKEQMGIKDRKALDMAINQPMQSVFGKELYPSLEEKGAILMINLIKKHPFYNANKRTAMMAMDIFLQSNNVEVEYPVSDGIELVVKIAMYDSKDFDELKEWVAQSIREHSKAD